MKQPDQNKESGLGLLGYAMWKSDIKSEVWMSSDVGIYFDSFPVSSYPSQITLYRSLHAHQQSILEFTIQEISYLGSLSIITGAEASFILLKKELDVAGLNIDTWKTE